MQDVLAKLDMPMMVVAEGPVGIDERVAALQERFWSTPGSGGAVGLHGMGGIGKTTLARAVYNAYHTQFGRQDCFLEVGRDAGRKQLVDMQKQVIRKLVQLFEAKFTTVEARHSTAEAELCSSAVPADYR